MNVVVDLGLRPPEEALATDEAILRAVACGNAPPTLRLWRNRRCVVVGRSQDPEREAETAACNTFGVPVLRRCSGGGAVYHHPGNLNFSLYLSLNGFWGGVRESQAWLAGRLAEALRRRWGLPAAPRQGAVFVRGRKISGSAQLRRRALLHHGTLLLWEDELDMRRLLRALRPGYSPGPVPSKAASTSDLSSLLGFRVGVEEGVEVLASAYRDVTSPVGEGGVQREPALSDRETGLLLHGPHSH